MTTHSRLVAWIALMMTPLLATSMSLPPSRVPVPLLTVSSAKVLELQCRVPSLRHWETIDKLELSFQSSVASGNGSTKLLGLILFDNFIRRGELPPMAKLTGNMKMNDPEKCFLHLVMPLTHGDGKYICKVFYGESHDLTANVSMEVLVDGQFKSTADRHFLVTVVESHEVLATWKQTVGTEIREVSVKRIMVSGSGAEIDHVTMYINDGKGNNAYENNDVLISSFNVQLDENNYDYCEVSLYVKRGNSDSIYKYETLVTTVYGTGLTVLYLPPLSEVATNSKMSSGRPGTGREKDDYTKLPIILGVTLAILLCTISVTVITCCCFKKKKRNVRKDLEQAKKEKSDNERKADDCQDLLLIDTSSVQPDTSSVQPDTSSVQPDTSSNPDKNIRVRLKYEIADASTTGTNMFQQPISHDTNDQSLQNDNDCEVFTSKARKPVCKKLQTQSSPVRDDLNLSELNVTPVPAVHIDNSNTDEEIQSHQVTQEELRLRAEDHPIGCHSEVAPGGSLAKSWQSSKV